MPSIRDVALAAAIVLGTLAGDVHAQAPAASSFQWSFLWRVDSLEDRAYMSLPPAEILGDPRFLTRAALQLGARAFSAALRPPQPVEMNGRRCGVPNALFDRTAEKVIVCYELAETLVKIFRAQDPRADAAQRGSRVAKALDVVLAHEVGHALIRRLDLPVLGRHEDAADQFALWFILEKADDSFELRIGKVSAFASALLELTDGELDRGSSFASSHPLAIQRAANVACWTAGYARSTGRVVDAFEAVIPTERRSKCEGEYRDLRTAWQKLLGPVLVR